MKSMIQCLDSKCHHCIKCLQVCPMNAISIVDGQVNIDEEKCIHCDVCIKECPSRVLKVQGVHMNETLHLHAHNVVLVPTSILSDCKSFEEYQKTCLAIKKLGFQEVIQYSDIEGALYKKAIEDSQKKEGIWLTSFCPTVNLLIEKNYPTLYDRLLPYDYPVEIAAKRIRERLKDKDLAIYSLCECVGKMKLAKEPFGNDQSHIDYAMSISHVFPKINNLITEDKYLLQINKYGLKSNVACLFGNRSQSIVSVEGLNQSKSILDLIEFDRIQHLDLISIYACYQGCIGGHFLWNNPFEGSYNIQNILNDCSLEMLELKLQDYYIERGLNITEMKTMQERMTWFKKVNDILETLPQYDCGACGFANCRSLAQSIVDGHVDKTACRVEKGD